MGDNSDKCGAELKTEDRTCERDAEQPDGRCNVHSEHTADNGPSEGSRNNPEGDWKHGLYAQNSKYYQRLTDFEKEMVEGMYESFMDDAPFDHDNVGKSTMVWQIAIDIHKKYRANQYIDAEGMTQKKTQAVSEHGPIRDDEENTLHITYDRLSRTTTRQLKELGIIGDDNADTEQAAEALLDILAGSDGDD